MYIYYIIYESSYIYGKTFRFGNLCLIFCPHKHNILNIQILRLLKAAWEWRIKTEGLGLKAWDGRPETEGWDWSLQMEARRLTEGLELKAGNWRVTTECLGLNAKGFHWKFVAESLGMKAKAKGCN